MKSSSNIRILYIGPIPPDVGGQTNGGEATYCWGLATQAHKQGYDVYIWTYAPSCNKEGIEIIGLPPAGNKVMKGIHSLTFYLGNRMNIGNLDFLTFEEKLSVLYKAYLIKEILKSIKPDLIHVIDVMDSVIFSLKAIKNTPPIIVSEHGFGLLYEYGMHEMFGIKEKSSLASWLEEALRGVDYVISVSEFSKFSLLSNFSLPGHVKINAILNPIDPGKMPLLDREREKDRLGLENKKVVCFCGTHQPIQRKGLDVLLRTIADDDYLRNNCKIVVITNEEAKFFAERFVKAKNIDSLILGPQPWENLVRCFNSADVFVMPSMQEGIGLVYYEALLAGVPVIGYFNSIKELEKVLDTRIGEKFDVNQDDEKSLAEKIKKVISSDFDRQLLRKRALDRLSWDAKFYEFDSVYREAVGLGFRTNPELERPETNPKNEIHH